MRMKSALVPVWVAAALAVAPGPAAAVDSGAPPSVTREHAEGKAAIDAKNWNAAIASLTAAAQRESRNADVQNLLGYAYRNIGQLEPAFKHYQRALQLDPRHLGAHEYIGEAYLLANNLAKAEEHLATLKRFCPGVCEEYDDLKRKIDQYRARGN
jgi:Flp pilus assembly protein TadD